MWSVVGMGKDVGRPDVDAHVDVDVNVDVDAHVRR